jgi:hypothetical protein
MTTKNLIKVIRKLIRKKSKIKPKQKITYTKDNKSLNDILNETVGLTKGSQEEYPDMGGKQYTSGNMADVLGYGDMASPELKRDRVAAQTLAEKGVTPDQVGDGVVNALTRDYSDLMKAINKGK